MTVRLGLVSHAATDATRSARFPVDETVNSTGMRDLGKADRARIVRADRVHVSPDLRASQTAEGLGVDEFVADPELRDIDYAKWAGLAMADVPTEDLHSWLTDPGSTPHGGESISALVSRVSTWMDGLEEGRVVAVTHQSVVRAAVLRALGAPLLSFWRIDVMPLSWTSLHRRGSVWTLRATSSKL